jgi:hypothetical protein
MTDDNAQHPTPNGRKAKNEEGLKRYAGATAGSGD